MTGGYRALFRRPGTARLAAAALLGRLPNGMLGLAFLLVLLDDGGSCAAGGAAAGLHTLTAAASGPLWSRAADRAGPRAVLLLTGTGQTLVLSAVAVLATRTENRPSLVALAAASGVLLPPLGAIMRALWSRTLADDPAAKAAAFAYESVVVDAVFVLGPSLVAGLAALGGPSLALLCAAAATAAGCLPVAASPRLGAAVRSTAVGDRNRPGPLRRPAVLGVLPIGFLLLGSVSAAEVSLVAFADGADRRDAAGPLVAALAAGGVLGGLCQGGPRRPGAAPARRLAFLLAALATGWAALAACHGLWQPVAVLVPSGVLLNAAVTAQFRTLDEVAPREALTEAFGWLNSLGAAGSSAGAAAAGAVAGPGPDPGAGFLLASGCCAAGCAVAVACRGMWRRVAPGPVPVPERPGPPGGVPSRRPR